jgi:aromatic ring-opening dioxygenase catalytic subunit (LigB family)
VQLLAKSGIDCHINATRGFEHGVFVPMLTIDPTAGIPVVMVSIGRDLDPPAHIERCRALVNWEMAPYARPAQPYEDHLMPLMVVAGAAGTDAGKRSFHDVLGGLSPACYLLS